MSGSGCDGGITKSGSDGCNAENKKNFLSENPGDLQKMSSSSISQTEFCKHGRLTGKLDNFMKEFGSLAELDKNLRELESNNDEWDDPVACHLVDLLFLDLHASLNRAIEKIVQGGYSIELAEQLILKSGIYHGLKDMPSNIVEGAFTFIRTGRDQQDPSEQHVFPNLESLVEFSLLEMVNILRHIKPCSSVTEAMWCLFICDLNLWYALAVPRDQLGLISFQDIPQETFSGLLSSMPDMDVHAFQERFYTRNISRFLLFNRSFHPPSNLKHFNSFEIPQKENSVVKSWDIHNKHSNPNAADMEEKSGGSRKGSMSSLKREMLQQKVFCMEKTYKGRMYKGVFKTKLIHTDNKGLDKAHKLSSGSSCAVIKSTCSKHCAHFGHGSPILEGTSKDSTSSTFIAKREAKCVGQSSEMPDYLAGIAYDESVGKFVPKDEDEATLLGLISKMRALQIKIQDYTNWANEKVMQATRRLVKDQAELKMLRQEKGDGEKFKKVNQTTEESTTKRLSEMENALSNSTLQFESATLTLCKLENENALLKTEAKDAEMKGIRTKNDLEEAMQREHEAMKNYRSADAIKVSLQKELTALKRRNVDLLNQLKIARVREEQLEVLRKQEEEEKLKYIEAATLKRSEIEKEKFEAKEKEMKMIEFLESNIQTGKEDMKKLEAEMSKLPSFSDSPRIAALLASAGTGFSCASISNIISATSSSHQESEMVSKRLAFLQEKLEPDEVAPERECIMCMTQEMSVVFLPCAHQVLCMECNDLHVKQGMVDCPSCRTHIQDRIPVRYED